MVACEVVPLLPACARGAVSELRARTIDLASAASIAADLSVLLAHRQRATSALLLQSIVLALLSVRAAPISPLFPRTSDRRQPTQSPAGQELAAAAAERCAGAAQYACRVHSNPPLLPGTSVRRQSTQSQCLACVGRGCLQPVAR
eukprot:99887-Chlamydomonas_euryale.AAC.1